MGFGHEWTFKKAYGPGDWASLEADAEALASGLPAALAEELAEAETLRPETVAIERALSELLASAGGPIRPGFPDGSYSGPCSSGAQRRSIQFGPGPHGEGVEIQNRSGPGFAKTGARPHDRVLIGLLCRAEELMPGNVAVVSSDGDEEYWEELLGLVDKAFGRPMPAPKGFALTRQRNARARAARESRAIEESTPAAPRRSAKRRV